MAVVRFLIIDFFWFTDILHALILVFREKQPKERHVQKCKFLTS